MAGKEEEMKSLRSIKEYTMEKEIESLKELAKNVMSKSYNN